MRFYYLRHIRIYHRRRGWVELKNVWICKRWWQEPLKDGSEGLIQVNRIELENWK